MDISKHNHYLSVKDYSTTQETFDLYHDPISDMLVTHPQPTLENLGKYYESLDYISHTDSKTTLFEKLYQFIKQFSLNRKLKLIQSFHPKNGKILDIGTGTGEFLIKMNKNGWFPTGIEPNLKAKKIAKSKGVTFVSTTHDLEKNSIDVITMWHVLEHVSDLDAQILELKRLLKPDGTLIIAVPNFKSFDAKHYGKYWAAYDAPIHFWHFSKKAIEYIFKQHKMKLFKTKPLLFDSFYVSLLSEKYKTGKMNYIAAITIGLISNLKAVFSKEYSSHIYIIKNE